MAGALEGREGGRRVAVLLEDRRVRVLSSLHARVHLGKRRARSLDSALSLLSLLSLGGERHVQRRELILDAGLVQHGRVQRQAMRRDGLLKTRCVRFAHPQRGFLLSHFFLKVTEPLVLLTLLQTRAPQEILGVLKRPLCALQVLLHPNHLLAARQQGLVQLPDLKPPLFAARVHLLPLKPRLFALRSQTLLEVLRLLALGSQLVALGSQGALLGSQLLLQRLRLLLSRLEEVLDSLPRAFRHRLSGLALLLLDAPLLSEALLHLALVLSKGGREGDALLFVALSEDRPALLRSPLRFRNRVGERARALRSAHLLLRLASLARETLRRKRPLLLPLPLVGRQLKRLVLFVKRLFKALLARGECRF
mmetsp:Transcript_50725/g.120809  ORF Transcript_50725/g.120809 Transcript_50725/m.120809 type:complete len:365 (-) Transcript_50725:381-1475(-)